MEQDDCYDDDNEGDNLLIFPRRQLTVLPAEIEPPILEMNVNNWVAGHSVNLANLSHEDRENVKRYLENYLAGNLGFPGKRTIGQPVDSNQFPGNYLAVKRTFGVLTLGYLGVASGKWYFKTDICGDFQELDMFSQYHWGINSRPKREGRIIEVSFR